ncbi:HEAT repeat domain-containing protein [Corynebacterium casei]|uniref:HEAT repeat domain-containing protein n=1 Tax=Corynebacterium casei TaxID=160386 RepID=UPI0009D364C3|nr:HEAT repeat domain-containing protein [Corynebacterium casei]SLM88757.1 hypothetical protein CZ765_04355 [Corynebacterium casei]
MNSSTRLRSALAMGTNPQSGDLPKLIEQLGSEPDFFVRDMLTWALTRHPQDEVYPLLVRALDNPRARAQALHTLSKLGHPDTWDVITPALLHDDDAAVRTTAWRVAVASVPEAEINELIAELVQEIGRVQVEPQRSLSRALASFGPLAREQVEHVVQHAQHVLALIDDPEREDHTHLEFARKFAALGIDSAD